MTHAIYILDFFLEFNGIKWSEKVEKCNSNKYCEITYAPPTAPPTCRAWPRRDKTGAE